MAFIGSVCVCVCVCVQVCVCVLVVLQLAKTIACQKGDRYDVDSKPGLAWPGTVSGGLAIVLAFAQLGQALSALSTLSKTAQSLHTVSAQLICNWQQLFALVN